MNTEKGWNWRGVLAALLFIILVLVVPYLFLARPSTTAWEKARKQKLATPELLNSCQSAADGLLRADTALRERASRDPGVRAELIYHCVSGGGK